MEFINWLTGIIKSEIVAFGYVIIGVIALVIGLSISDVAEKFTKWLWRN